MSLPKNAATSLFWFSRSLLARMTVSGVGGAAARSALLFMGWWVPERQQTFQLVDAGLLRVIYGAVEPLQLVQPTPDVRLAHAAEQPFPEPKLLKKCRDLVHSPATRAPSLCRALPAFDR